MLSAATLPLSPVFVHTLGYVDVFFFLFYFPVFAAVRCVVSPIKVCAIKFQRYEHREREKERTKHTVEFIGAIRNCVSFRILKPTERARKCNGVQCME